MIYGFLAASEIRVALSFVEQTNFQKLVFRLMQISLMKHRWDMQFHNVW
ncbi:hypothetical protein MGWOODY_Mmi2648 [hydrothermal vent metagenome]|uniref:Uncharacterized protein n=1 Tax=hydrothermal vent metagenome TaxID=652676 RepID=A0A160VI94_9ZZZZ